MKTPRKRRKYTQVVNFKTCGRADAHLSHPDVSCRGFGYAIDRACRSFWRERGFIPRSFHDDRILEVEEGGQP